MKLPMILL